jgi:hypothetical protein
MKFILIHIICWLSVAQIASATLLRIESVTQPLYLHGADSDPRISFQAVPCVTFASDPEWRFGAISAPFIPSTAGTWRPHDINLISLYRIIVDGTYKEDGKDILVTVDASKATRPENYPFTIEQVIDAAITCVKIMYPTRPADDGVLDISIIRPAQQRATK